MEPTGESADDDDKADPGRVARTTNRLKAEQSRLTQRIVDTRERLERSRPNSPLIDAGFRAIERDIATGGVVLAGAVAFRVFLFVVPYVFVAVVGFGFAAEAADQDAGDLAREAGIGGLVAKAVGGAADLSGFSRVTALIVGVVALLFGSRALLKVLRIVYGLVWGVTPAQAQAAGAGDARRPRAHDRSVRLRRADRRPRASDRSCSASSASSPCRSFRS